MEARATVTVTTMTNDGDDDDDNADDDDDERPATTTMTQAGSPQLEAFDRCLIASVLLRLPIAPVVSPHVCSPSHQVEVCASHLHSSSDESHACTSGPRGPSGRARRGVFASAVADWGRFAYHAPRLAAKADRARAGRPAAKAGRARAKLGYANAKPEQAASARAGREGQGSSVNTCG